MLNARQGEEGQTHRHHQNANRSGSEHSRLLAAALMHVLKELGYGEAE